VILLNFILGHVTVKNACLVCMRIITLKKYKLFLKNKSKDLKQKLPSNIYSMIHQDLIN